MATNASYTAFTNNDSAGIVSYATTDNSRFEKVVLKS